MNLFLDVKPDTATLSTSNFSYILKVGNPKLNTRWNKF